MDWVLTNPPSPTGNGGKMGGEGDREREVWPTACIAV